MMNDNMMTGALLQGSSVGMLDLEGHLQHHQHQSPHPQHHQIPQTQLAHQQHLQTMNMIPMNHSGASPLESDQSLAMMEFKPNPKSSFSGPTKARTATSDEDEPSFTEDGIDSHGVGGKSKKNNMWQRMKWTDAMVKLLITVVLYVGEDNMPDYSDGNKRKAGVMQKKGKWKTVSSYMARKGCFVSPQQCEDKFNDLNKRYKRLNDILGKGTTCDVVENPSLLDSMHHLSAKTKEDVRKLLSSKHLFYKEMCAYHNGTVVHSHAETESHSSMQSLGAAKDKGGLHSCGVIKVDGIGSHEDGDQNEENDEAEEDDDDDDYDDDEEEEDEDDGACDNEIDPDVDVKGVGESGKRMGNKSSEENNYFARSFSSQWPKLCSTDNLNKDPSGLCQEGNKILWEQKEWVRRRTLQLKEQRVALQAEAFELEKRRFKWQKTCAKRDKELERLKIENEKMKLENERMAMHIKQRELEVEYKRSEAAMTSVALAFDGVQGRDQNDLASGQGLQ
eukprot:TRINITY_DN4872_c0_g1_i1.p1 TRINITY_DN4872_c0_g1~~TRINITY_DN4872_c0_g1_i1.p1  ORF type:complete len:504 (+),score=151.25 TRINITY_DN4872_c0_g1_i1:726-2237(+)